MIWKCEEYQLYKVRLHFGNEVDEYFISDLSEMGKLEEMLRDRCGIEPGDFRAEILGKETVAVTVPIE